MIGDKTGFIKLPAWRIHLKLKEILIVQMLHNRIIEENQLQLILVAL